MIIQQSLILLICECIAEKSNVLVIMMDDLGWSDVSWNNKKAQTTPMLEEMAKNGTILVCYK